jgi:hypothetical protein
MDRSFSLPCVGSGKFWRISLGLKLNPVWVGLELEEKTHGNLIYDSRLIIRNEFNDNHRIRKYRK